MSARLFVRIIMHELKLLVNNLLNHLEDIGYKPSYIYSISGHLKKLIIYFALNSELEFTRENCDKFLKEKYNCSLKDPIPKNKMSQFQACRAVNLLIDFQAGKQFAIRYNLPREELPNIFETKIAEFKDYSVNILNHKFKTIESNIRWIRRFLEFCHKENLNTPCNFSEDTVIRYLENLNELRPKSKVNYLNAIKLFDQFLLKDGVISESFCSEIKIKRGRYINHIPVWTSEELIRLLSSFDLVNPTELRDRAMILLAARTGLRISDIRNLKIKDVDFRKKIITIKQSKTLNIVELPLTNDVGWAIIDYIRNGRPKVKNEYIFLRHSFPITPFGEESNQNFRNRILRYAKRAGIDRKKGLGFHSLRYSIATQLLLSGASVPIISSILGHQSINTTNNYLILDRKNISLCPIDIDEILGI